MAQTPDTPTTPDSGGSLESPESAPSSSGEPRAGLSRRGLLATAGVGAAAGVILGAGGAQALTDGTSEPKASDRIDLSGRHTFYTGEHQAGIETAPQRYCVFMTFDLKAATADELKVLLARWSGAIAQLMAGRTVGSVQPDRSGAVPTDTGEALDLEPSSLTVTLGIGPGVFGERYGLAKRPRLLEDLPRLPSDNLAKATTGGDLSLQACADDPQVAYHAIRDLARIGRGTVDTRWTVMGFGRASAGKGQTTPRNLLGFKDGTRNIREGEDFDRFVWVDDDVDWMRGGGSYQVARKIRMNIEIWDADDVADQQRIFGRSKEDGAPLTGHEEFDTPDFGSTKAGHSIDPSSHIALAAHENNDGVKILRRSYNFTDGINDVGQLDAGLLFLAYMNDPAHFVRLQTRLGGSDLLNEYISHIGSAVFAVPPAPKPGHFLAEGLFA